MDAMTSGAASVAEYLEGLPEDRRAAISAVREAIGRSVPEGVEEGMQYGMIGWYVPHSVYPHGYHCDPKQPLPFASLASQKAHMALHLMAVYIDPKLRERFLADAEAAGCKLDMGKSCIRFKRLEDLPVEAILRAIGSLSTAEYIALYEAELPDAVKKKRAKSS
jgi:hypothetical protein